MTDSAHSVLPPSSAKAWKLCAMWPTMNRLYPKPDTPDTLEGTAAHWAFCELFDGRPIDEGLIAPNGTMLTMEMVEGAELYVDTVHDRLPDGIALHVEQPVAIKRVHPECWGTPDTWFYDRTTGTLEVFDYKFGHRFVDEYENDQGIAYVSGILDQLQLDDQAIRVNFTVVQPRCFQRGAPVRTWSVRASDLRAHVNHLANAARLVMVDKPTATTNSECRDCPGQAQCPALQQAAYSDAEYSYTGGPVDLPPEAASLELRMLERASERLDARISGLREAVTAYGRQGLPTPYHKLEQGYGRQQWTVGPSEAIAIGAMMGVDISKPGVMTPKQAEKAGVDGSVIKAYSATPMGSVTLIPCNPADARRVFGIVTSQGE